MVLQAEFLMRRLTTRRRVLYPQSSVATTLAMALDKVNDFWWSDRYWPIAAEAAEDHFKVITCSYWGAALCRRGAFTKGRDVVNNALDKLSSDDADSWIVKADACLTMSQWDKKQAVNWLDRAKHAYRNIPEHDRHEAYAPHGVPLLTLQGFDLSGANLKHVNMADADLTGANLAGADLTGANLTNANLTDANFADTILTGADLNGAIINQNVAPPDGWERDNNSGRLTQASVATA
jgi:Pentapeptide repeats (8 copies)